MLAASGKQVQDHFPNMTDISDLIYCDRIGEDKVPDFVESSLVQELECVKLWQRRIQAAIEQVG